MLEVSHNPDALIAHKSVVVRNIRHAQQTLRQLMDEKRPRGMRLRHSYDFPTKRIYLEARSQLMLETALIALRRTGNVIKIDLKRVQ